MSFSGDLGGSGNIMEEITLDPDQALALIYNLNISTTKNNASIEMQLSRGSIIYYNETLDIDIIPDALEIVRTTYPSLVTQWDFIHMIMIVDNNRKQEESYTLTIVEQNPQFGVIPANVVIESELSPGRNRIEAYIFSTLNPYEFGVKTYYFELKDSKGEIIDSGIGIFQVSIELSIAALFFCYIIPISLPIIGILIYKNKELKNKLLRRR